MKKLLWGGRFEKGPSRETLEFNSSENIRLDERLLAYDILGSLAHVRMLYQREILPTADFESISGALKAILEEAGSGAFGLDPALEDVHMNVESAVSKLTKSGKKMHTARSRNDQVLLDMRLFMRDRVLETAMSLIALQEAFAEVSKKDGPMAAYTHTRVAQPITVSFWCDGWAQSFGRDIERLQEAYSRVNRNPLGACAVAGTPWGIDRNMTAELLAFDSVQENELDTVTSRGECEAELLSCLSLIMCKLSRLSEELIWLSEKGLITISEEHSTGSSIMPNKKNPDVLELVRGRCGRVYGNLTHCLTTLKGLMSGYHSDMQETKFAIMSGFDTTESSLHAFRTVLGGISFERQAIEKELDGGYAQATEIADHLAMAGIPFRDAHAKAGELVRRCETSGKRISELEAKEAGKILGLEIPEGRWVELRSFERPRLKRKVQTSDNAFVQKEMVRIAKAYSML